jgi:hypothetical protein
MASGARATHRKSIEIEVEVFLNNAYLTSKRNAGLAYGFEEETKIRLKTLKTRIPKSKNRGKIRRLRLTCDRLTSQLDPTKAHTVEINSQPTWARQPFTSNARLNQMIYWLSTFLLIQGNATLECDVPVATPLAVSTAAIA